MIQINSIKVITEFVDTETGEIFNEERVLGEETKKEKKTSTRTKKPKDDGSTEPQVTLLDGKIQLNNAAMSLTQWEADMKIDIRFEKKGRKITPILVPDEAKGNRLTKSQTISCRGTKHDNLSEYGSVFSLIPYDGHEGWFILKGDNPEKEDDIIDVPEEISNPDEEEFSLDSDTTEISFDLDI